MQFLCLLVNNLKVMVIHVFQYGVIYVHLSTTVPDFIKSEISCVFLLLVVLWCYVWPSVVTLTGPGCALAKTN